MVDYFEIVFHIQHKLPKFLRASASPAFAPPLLFFGSFEPEIKNGTRSKEH